VVGEQTTPKRPTYVCNEYNVRGNQQGEEGDNVGVSAVKVCVIGPARFCNGILSRIQLLLILPNKVPNLVAWKTLE